MLRKHFPWACKVTLGLSLVLALTGCAIFGGGRPLRVPSEFVSGAKADWAADPAARTDFYHSFFPELPKIHILGQFVAHSRLMPDSEPFDCTYFALDRDRLRMRISIPNGLKLLTDLLVDQGVLVIKMPEENLVFRGALTNGQTPFGRQYGIEPWNLIPVFRIGQTLASESFKAKVHRRTIRLTPEGAVDADGLTRVDLDRRSGLPVSAVWKPSNGKDFEVRYLKWDYFADRSGNGLARLMPAEFDILSHSSPGALRVTLPNRENWGYYFGDRVPPMMFKMRLEPGLNIYSLDQLDEVLSKS